MGTRSVIRGRGGTRDHDPEHPETGARDQFQLYEAILASGECVGVGGKEGAAQARRLAIEDGVVHATSDERGNRT